MGEPAKWSRGKLEAVPNCPACGSAARRPLVLTRHDDGGVMPDLWSMHACASCGSIYLDPRPDPESLPRAYADYYTHQAESEDVPDRGGAGLGWRLIHGYLNWRFGMHRQPANGFGRLVFTLIEPWRLKLDYYGRHLTRNRRVYRGRLLDIGCGNGAFLARARDMGWQVVGCEPDREAIMTCRALGLDVRAGDAFMPDLDNERFDVITLSHVIEHVHNPVALLARVYGLLRPGGLLWLATPNPASLGLRVYGAAWRGLHMPYHLCIPSQPVLMHWLEGVGFVHPRLVRRGAHARNQWRDSRAIARREGLPVPGAVTYRLTRTATDVAAALSPRRAEETVLMARKLADRHDR
ncbi:MAG: class I SAM-dependent methyltransferase [Gammaproteobacteria bacterium]